MNKVIQKHWFTVGIVLMIIVILSTISYRLWFQSNIVDERLTIIKKAPEFQLTDIEGNRVKMSDSNGKVRLVYFFFASCPDVCLPTTFFLSKVQDELKQKGLFAEDSVMLSITVDPSRDTPEALQTYSAQFQADASGWKFLRGDEEQVKQLAEQFGIMVVKDKDGNFTHSNSILLVDRLGNLRNYYNANDEDLVPSYIVKDVQTLSKLN